MSRFISLYDVTAYYHVQGYQMLENDWRKWGGWTWAKFRMPNGQIFKVVKRGSP